MEIIAINGLELRACHGVGAQERMVGNLFKVYVSIDVNLERAMMSDCVDDTVNYAEVIGLVKREMAIPSALLENVVWRIREALKREFPAVTGGSVRIDKITPPVSCKVDSVSVSTRW